MRLRGRPRLPCTRARAAPSGADEPIHSRPGRPNPLGAAADRPASATRAETPSGPAGHFPQRSPDSGWLGGRWKVRVSGPAGSRRATLLPGSPREGGSPARLSPSCNQSSFVTLSHPDVPRFDSAPPAPETGNAFCKLGQRKRVVRAPPAGRGGDGGRARPSRCWGLRPGAPGAGCGVRGAGSGRPQQRVQALYSVSHLQQLSPHFTAGRRRPRRRPSSGTRTRRHRLASPPPGPSPPAGAAASGPAAARPPARDACRPTWG